MVRHRSVFHGLGFLVAILFSALAPALASAAIDTSLAPEIAVAKMVDETIQAKKAQLVYIGDEATVLLPAGEQHLTPIATRHSPVPLKPDYLASMRTDALNFVELRRRC